MGFMSSRRDRKRESEQALKDANEQWMKDDAAVAAGATVTEDEDGNRVIDDHELGRLIVGDPRPSSGGTVAGDFDDPSAGSGAGLGKLDRSSGMGRAFGLDRMDEVYKEVKARREAIGDDDVVDFSQFTRKEREALNRSAGKTLDIYPHLLALKPKEGYVFHSDYVEIDHNRVQTILTFVHDDAAVDNFGAFWGMLRIPQNLDRYGVTSTVIDQVGVKPEKWVADNIAKSGKITRLDAREQSETGTTSTKWRSAKRAEDNTVVTMEINNGDAYLEVQSRMILSAPDVESMDLALDSLRSNYVDFFNGNLKLVPLHGRQRSEMSDLLDWNKAKNGSGFFYTTTEYAGSYSLVTNGLTDDDGVYVGAMEGDINNSPVLFDVNRWNRDVVVADDQMWESPKQGVQQLSQYSDVWGAKIAQQALIGNNRVVHLVLNDCNLDLMNPDLSSMTLKIDMASGDVNMMEVFGDISDELSLFSMHIDKLKLMVRLLFNDSETMMTGKSSDQIDSDEKLLYGHLSKILENFYVGVDMWRRNPDAHRDDLRIVGINHDEVPVLHDLMTYVRTDLAAAESGREGAGVMAKPIKLLDTLLYQLLSVNSDLFDKTTNMSIDAAQNARRVIYDFAGLTERSETLAMVQLVNVIAYAVNSLREDDVVVIHGMDAIKNTDVQHYVSTQLNRLKNKRRGRVCWCYDSVEAMIDNREFNHFERSDYTLLGPMEAETLNRYQDAIGQSVPDQLGNLLIGGRQSGQNRGNKVAYYYLRREFTNVFFKADIPMGLSTSAQRAEAEAKNRVESLNGPVSAATGVTEGDDLRANLLKEIEDAEVEGRTKESGPLATEKARATAEKKKTDDANDDEPTRDGGFARFTRDRRSGDRPSGGTRGGATGSAVSDGDRTGSGGGQWQTVRGGDRNGNGGLPRR